MVDSIIVSLTAFIPVFILLSVIGHPTLGKICLNKKDFQRLVVSETNIKIIWTKSWGIYYYFANVGGNQIYTTSRELLEFPDSCELIPVKPITRKDRIN